MKNVYDLIIIGAGSAGLSAALYAGRANLKTLIISKDEAGGQIRITNDVANYPGIIQTTGPELGEVMKKQAINFGAEFLIGDVKDVDLASDIKKIYLTSGETYEAVGVIIASGATPRALGFDGEKEFMGRGVGYCATCDGEFFKGLDIFVIGAGFAAAEEALFLTKFGKKVIVIAREPEFTCSKSIGDKVLANPKIEVRFNTEILSIKGTNVLKSAHFINNVTNEKWDYEVADPKSTFGVFVFVGYQPQSELFKGKVALNDYGYIVTDEELLTSVAGVYAAGDIRPKSLRQIVTAVSDGAIAATNIQKYIDDKKEELGIVIEQESSENKATTESFLGDDIKEQLTPVFEKFERKVKMNVIVLREGNEDLLRLSKEIKSFAKEFEGFSKMLEVNIFYNDDKNESVQKVKDAIGEKLFPVISIFTDENEFSGISFHAVPGGHEFNSFIIGLYNVAGPGQAQEESVLTRIALLNKKANKKVNIKVLASLSCTMCPDVVVGTQMIASKNKNVTAQMIDLGHFSDLRNEYNIMSVPAIIVNDSSEVIFGKKSVDEILSIIERA